MLALLADSAVAQDVPSLRISEILASNNTSLEDGYGGSPDWIEIHNEGAESVSMNGLFLTDDRNVPEKWAFPVETEIEGGGYLVVLASGRDTIDSDSGDMHANFRLSSQGDYVALTQSGGITVDEIADGFPVQKPDISYGIGSSATALSETILFAGAAARWFVPDSELEQDWRLTGFDDSSWNAGLTGIGYGYDGLVGEGGDARDAMRGVNASIFVRIPFEIEDPRLVNRMSLRMKYEDGFVAYLNGEEVARANAPETLLFDSQATELNPDIEAEVFEMFELNIVGKLEEGSNVLAIHGLNLTAAGSNSSDFLLLPELDVEILSGEGELVFGYFEKPTPGVPNGAIDFSRYLQEPVFDVARGFYEDPFSVNITSTEPGADLVYTTDSSTPSAENGTRIAADSPTALMQATVEVESTAILRAVSLKEGLPSYKTVTATYLFLDDVLDQPANPDGYPSSWFAAGAADYEMDPEIVGQVYSREELKQGLRSLPTISLVTDVSELFGQRTGIQINPQRTGPEWEKYSSVEFIDFEDGEPVQFDCGWRMSGNASRSPSRPKHNLRIVFRPEYDKTPLEYPLFGTLEVQRFRTFILRGFNGDSWIHPDNAANGQYIRDQWYRDAHSAMGYEETLQREVHVYYNGLYWGVHHLFERTEDDFAVEHFGGEPDEWDGVRITAGGNVTTIDGTLDAWNETRNLALARDYEGIQDYLDLDAFIDYLMVNFYGGNGDWDQNNVRALRSRAEGGRWRFFCHDSERAGFNAGGGGSVNADVTTKNTARGPTEMHQRLSSNEEYRLRFADRVQKHLFNGGALTPARAEALWRARADGIRDALKVESARWGDAKRSRPMTLIEWERLVQREYDAWFPVRTDIAISQFKRRDLFPDLAAPELSQHGGVIEDGASLRLANEEGSIYYTLDGSDPRLEGGDPNPEATAIAGSTVLQEVFPAGSSWRYLDNGANLGSSEVTEGRPGYGEDNWKHPQFSDAAWESGAGPLGYGGITSAELATEIEYGGDRSNRHITTYFRKSFEVTDSASVTELLLQLLIDDGAVVYVNGQEVLRVGMPEGEVTNVSLAANNISGAKEGVYTPFQLETNALVTGRNVIAVELHQVAAGSSDLGFDCRMQLEVLNQGNSPISLVAPVTVKTRSFKDGEWSALVEATFVSGLAPVAGSISVSEIHYNPMAATAAELEQPFVADNDDFEFLELRNNSSELVDLSLSRFVRGIDFTFPEGTLLAPDGHLVIVRNAEAFRFRYPGVSNVQIAGEFANGTGLSNGGEWLTLESPSGDLLLNFRYDDRSPWPLTADGEGKSLELAGAGDLNPNVATNWGASESNGGSPGGSESGTAFPSDSMDTDGNGLTDFLDFLFANDGADAVFPSAVTGADGSVSLRFRLRTDVAGLTLALEASRGLDSSWEVVSNFDRTDEVIDDRSASVSLRLPESAEIEQYYRIRFSIE